MGFIFRKSGQGITILIMLIWVLSFWGCNSNNAPEDGISRIGPPPTGKAAAGTKPLINEILGSTVQNRYIKGIAGSRMIYTDAGGQDTYTILPAFCGDVEIIDNDISTVNLPAGLNISSSQFMSDKVQLTINGFTLILGGKPSLFNFVFAGTPLSNATGVLKTYAQIAQAFGTTIPAAGQSANQSTVTGIIQADGSIKSENTDIENQENYTYKLAQSNANYILWTTLPSERVFKNDPVPDTVADSASSKILVYAAKNESEPFQVIIKPSAGVSGNITVNMGAFGSGIETEIHQVKYVNITQATDALGKTGYYPDPLWPVENGASVSLTANENTAFWITVHISGTAAAGDYSANFTITSSSNPSSSVTVPVSLHVFNFSVPDEIHAQSQMNFSHNTILQKYGVSCCGDKYWKYVDMIKQYFIDHRLTPTGILWSGGLTSNGGAPYIDYDCATGTFTDNDGIWGFEEPAKRYLDGSGLMNRTFDTVFNGGTGFPSFMAVNFQNNDSSADQRPSTFCGLTRTASDWYTAANPDSPYNKAWFSYMASIESYLSSKEYLDKAYYYMANEPQDQADYDAVAWYSQELKKSAPNLKLMVSEEAKPEIYSNPKYPGAKIDIWLPVLNNFDPVIANTREYQFNEETWIYWLHGTRPPYFNPITLDHPGIESKLTGWFLWKYRVRGIAYYSLNNWSKNPWTDPMTDGHNGDLFMLYPPSESNNAITYGANNHRLVPSIRLELMRDSLEDYEYLYVLNGGKQPEVTSPDLYGTETQADSAGSPDIQADKIITGVASYTRDSGFVYNLRRLIGLKNGGEIPDIPDIKPAPAHNRSAGVPGNYYINFQNPQESFSTEPYGNPVMKDQIIDGVSYRILDYDGRTYYAIGPQAYDEEKGYGWFGNIINQPGQRRDPWGNETDERKRTYIYDDYGRVNTFEFALPNGEYEVFLCVGTPRNRYSHNNVKIEGTVFVDDEQNNYFIERSKTVKVSDNSLTVEIGLTGMDEYTMLNYMHIEANTSMQ